LVAALAFGLAVAAFFFGAAFFFVAAKSFTSFHSEGNFSLIYRVRRLSLRASRD
jgi:hypothetical protein